MQSYVVRDNIMLLCFHDFGMGAAVCVGCHMSTKTHGNVGGQM